MRQRPGRHSFRSPRTGRFTAMPRARGITTTRSTDPKRGVFTRLKVLGAEITYRETGGDWGVLRERLDAVQRRANKLTVPFEAFRQVWFDQNMRIFEAEGIPPWAPLTEDYAKWKNTLGFSQDGRPILQLRGRLGRSLTEDTDDTIFLARPKSLQMGTAVEYSPILQGGTDNMEPRPHDVLLPETFATLMQMVGDYVELPLEDRGA